MEKSEKNRVWFMIIKSVLLTVAVSLAFVLVFGIIVKLTSLSETVIRPINQFIKVVAIFVGCFFSLSGEKGYLKGGISGLLSALFTYLLFCLISSGSFSVAGFFLDLLFGVTVGVIFGILTVNLKSKN